MHPPLRTHHNCQTQKQAVNQHSLVNNPPFSKNVSKDHSLFKIFNRNTIKISYSCMNNTKQVIDNHNKRILYLSHSSYTKGNKDGTRTNKTCNCQQKNNCPLNGNCLQSSVVYQATVTRNNNNTSETRMTTLTIDLSSSSPHNSSSKRCNLCLKEKFLIIYQPDLSSLNRRNEIVSSCGHRNKVLLRNS